MTNFIIPLIPTDSWVILFSSSFFFGLIFFIFVIINGMEHSDADHDLDHDTSFDHDLNASVDHDLGVSADHDLDSGIDHDIDNGIEHDLDTSIDHDVASAHTETGLMHTEQIDNLLAENQKYIKKSRYLMGNITVFMTTFGATGLLYRAELTDLVLLQGIAMGIIFARFFAYGIAKIAEDTNNPYIGISFGDEIQTVHEFNMKQKGVCNVIRRDGMESTVMAIGEVGTDIFRKNERGYIIGKINGNLYVVSKSVSRVQDLQRQYEQQN